MHVTRIDERIHLVDLEPAGIENFIASYILRGNHVAIVETGPASTVHNLLASLKEQDVKPEEVAYVAVSHIHLDHSGGAGTLLKHLPNAKLIVHQRGASHIANPEKLWTQAREALGNIAEIYGKPEPVQEEKIIAATDGMTFDVGDGVKLRVVETLGHASHHSSYYEPLSQGVFTGDAAGVYLKKFDIVVPTAPPPFRLDIALASLTKLLRLKPKHLYYTHFGKAENAAEKLQAYAKRLKLWASTVKEGMAKGESLGVLSKRIFEKDKAIEKAVKYIKAHPVMRETVINQNLQGFIYYIEKFGQLNP